MSLPQRMRAIEISEPGGPDVLKLATLSVPSPKPGEVLIKVHSAGVNRPDCLQRAGAYPPPPDASPLPGLEVSGEVVALGPDVSNLREGTTVCALTPGGGYAEYCTAPAAQCLPIPKGYDLLRAAALPETFFTVYYNVFMRSQLTAGERLLVHGGSSGIGTTAIQLAKAFGAYVAITAGSDDKCQACLDLGADKAINYKTQNWVEEAMSWSKEQGGTPGTPGLDVILDMVGGSYISPGLRLLRRDGRYAFIAFLEGSTAEVDFSPVLRNRLWVGGSTLRPQTAEEKGVIADALHRDIWPLIEAGKVAPVMAQSFPLDRAADAHALMESSNHIGKIMLTVGE